LQIHNFLLYCKAQSGKCLPGRLKITVKNDLKIERVEKPWGYELIWAKTEKYAAKILHITKGKRLSLQYHQHKDEAMLVASGKIQVEIEKEGEKKKFLTLKAGECLHLPPLTRHRLTAFADADIFEVSTPELDDVIRLEDDHGRIAAVKPKKKRKAQERKA